MPTYISLSLLSRECYIKLVLKHSGVIVALAHWHIARHFLHRQKSANKII